MLPKTSLFILTLSLSLTAVAATETKGKQGNTTWSAATGLGYDSNIYQAPSAPYNDYAVSLPVPNPLVTPKTVTGFFVPLEMKVTTASNQDASNRLIGAASLKGDFYASADVRNANEYDLDLNGGKEHILEQKGVVEDTIFYGIFAGKHKQVYTDRDTGLDKTTSTRAIISDRYNYSSLGVEAEYKHRTGSVDYGVKGKFTQNDYEDPVVVSQLDHTHLKVSADVDFKVGSASKLNLEYNYAVQDFSDRHSRNEQGVYSSANPLLQYTFNGVSASLRNRMSADWILYLDYDYTQRADGYVSYNDYTQNKYVARVLYAHGRLKGRVALGYWTRDYPNAFAFDVATRGKKTYNGSNLKFKVEWSHGKNSSLWTEMVLNMQNSSDLRYDYDRNQIMAGMSWTY